jgi:hypothetical protein
MKTSPQLETTPVKELVVPGMRWRKNYIALSLPRWFAIWLQRLMSSLLVPTR